jgi:hypothetical protein
MHIQTFLLAKRVTMTGNNFDVEGACICGMSCTPETEFPIRFTLPALIVLSRENSSGEAPASLQFDLVDEDGMRVGAPRHMICRGVFPDGIWFARLMAKIDFEFPSPGRYRLDIKPDEGQTDEVYQYTITITETPAAEST